MKPEDLFDTNSLLQRVQVGDERAVEMLYQRYIARVQRWARGRLPLSARDLHDTQSIAHDVLVRSLLKATQNAGGIRSTFRGYVQQALRNQLSDLVRAKKDLWLELEAETADNKPSELELILEREFERHVRRHVDELPRASRELLFLRFEMGHSYAELAAHLGVSSEDAARMRVNRILAGLRDQLTGAR